jgi:exosortase/archaeosortase family protein
MRRFAIVAVVAAACWDSWRWYVLRVSSTPEEAVALIVAVGLVMLLPGGAASGAIGSSNGGRWSTAGLVAGDARWNMHALTVLLMLYALSALHAPPIMRAGIAVLALLAALHGALRCAAPPPALWLIGLLAMPIVPTLQFYLGYPMRVVSAAVAVVLLRLNGLSVDRQGTYLVWRGDLVQFDAPCSGVSMLWAGLLLTSMLAYIYQLGVWRLIMSLAACAVLLVIANIMRATSLFYLETGVVAWAPGWAHEASGLAVFAVAAFGIVWLSRKLAPDLCVIGGVVIATTTGHCVSVPRQSNVNGRAGICGGTVLRVPTPLSSAERALSVDPRWWAGVLAASLVVAAFSPSLARTTTTSSEAAAPFPGWPSQYDGRTISALPMTVRETAFAADFPGRIGRFSDGEREIIVRYVAAATRKLHPAADCFRGLGYTITPVAMRRNSTGRAMSCFQANGKGGQFRVCEHLDEVSGDGSSWPDIGAWYWHALFRKDGRGWWSYTVAERI